MTYPHTRCEDPPPAYTDDPQLVVARILHRMVSSCDCGATSSDDLHMARELVWRVAAHGLVLVDVDELDRMSSLVMDTDD